MIIDFDIFISFAPRTSVIDLWCKIHYPMLIRINILLMYLTTMS